MVDPAAFAPTLQRLAGKATVVRRTMRTWGRAGANGPMSWRDLDSPALASMFDRAAATVCVVGAASSARGRGGAWDLPYGAATQGA